MATRDSGHETATVHHIETLPTIKEDGPTRDGLAARGRSVTNTSTRSTGASARLYGVRTALGLHAQAPIDEQHDAEIAPTLFWPRIRLALREPFGEFMGVFVMIMFGCGSVAQVLLSGTSDFALGAPGRSGFGEYQSINWGWALGVAIGVLVAGQSGGFLNPAITFTNCVLRGLPWRRFPIYLIAQFLGGFVGSGVVYANYINGIDAYAGQGVRTVPPASTSTGQIFCTYPQAFLTKASQFFSEFINSALLLFCVYAMKDATNSGGLRSDGNWFIFGIFLLIFGLGCCFGYNTGYSMNLARDLGPRLMSTIVGYDGAWSAGDYYFWIPCVAPFLGCLFGGFLYDLLLYTGPDSPINTPYLGIPFLLRPDKALKDRWAKRPPEIPFEDGLTLNGAAGGNKAGPGVV